MKFILDAHIPPSLQPFLVGKGFDTSHTKDLPLQNATDDLEIIKVSMQEKRVVVTKDSDFFDTFLLKKEPYKILFIQTGNISTKDLKSVFETFLEDIIMSLQNYDVVNLHKDKVIPLL